MLIKIQIISILQIIITRVKGEDLEPKYAVSSQSYHRGDVPLSYQFTAVHIYTTPSPKLAQWHNTLGYDAIQYAPLDTSYYIRNAIIPAQTEEPIKDGTEGTKDSLDSVKYLEPQFASEDLQRHSQNIRSYIPGYNIAIQPSVRGHEQSDLYRSYHNYINHPKIKDSKYSTFQNYENYIPEEQSPNGKQDILNLPESVKHFEVPADYVQNYVSKNYKFLSKPLGNSAGPVETLQRPLRPLVNQMLKNHGNALKTPAIYQALSALVPRVHLNLARVYGVAHSPDQGSHNHEKVPLRTEAIFLPLQSYNDKNTLVFKRP